MFKAPLHHKKVVHRMSIATIQVADFWTPIKKHSPKIMLINKLKRLSS